jgi:hypothetical protein
VDDREVVLVKEQERVGTPLLGAVVRARGARGYRNAFYRRKTERYAALSSYFLNRPGRYYWQPYLTTARRARLTATSRARSSSPDQVSAPRRRSSSARSTVLALRAIARA